MKVKTRSFTKSNKKIIKKRGTHLLARKKFCRFCTSKVKTIDYKDVKRLEAFVTERGKIVSSRFSGNCAKHQRRVVEAIKKARFLSLLPYIR
ncbi:MAG: 30S ribosomal protein S18 [Candidatus Omnitrophica bacterium]|nr:30S ribosomal protein S18 [Candidatus Omnitrophota bacterium]MBL7151405.1 30S ribosomal protein S18 [Candidatus Omnitrophota bacterium]